MGMEGAAPGGLEATVDGDRKQQEQVRLRSKPLQLTPYGKSVVRGAVRVFERFQRSELDASAALS